MDKIIKKLTKAPKFKLSLSADLRIRFKLYSKIIEKNLGLSIASLFKRFFASLAVLFLIIAVPGYAYASPSVNHSHFLYPLKISMEKVELAFTNTEAGKTGKYIKFAEKRFLEVEQLSSGPMEREAVINTINNINVLNKQAEVEFDKIEEDNEKEGLKEHLKNSKRHQSKKAKKLAGEFGIEAEDELIDSLLNLMDYDKEEENDDEPERNSINNHFISNKNKEKTDEKNNKSETDKNGQLDKSKPGEDNEDEDEKGAVNENNNTPGTKNNDEYKTEIKIKSADLEDELINLLEEAKSKVKITEDDFKSRRFPEKEVDKLVEKLNFKINKAESALEDDQIEEFQGLMKSTDSLRNNAKYFINGDMKDKRDKENDNDRDKKEKYNRIEAGNKTKERRVDSENEDEDKNKNNGADKKKKGGRDKKD